MIFVGGSEENLRVHGQNWGKCYVYWSVGHKGRKQWLQTYLLWFFLEEGSSRARGGGSRVCSGDTLLVKEEEAKEGVDAVAREEVMTALPLPTEEMEGDEEGELELEAASEEETLKRNP